VEIPGKRTATTRTFQLPSGEFETRIYEVPINYWDEKGDWQPIDQSLEETGSGAVSNGDNSFDVHLPEDLDEAPVRVMLDEQWVSQAPLGLDTDPVELEDGVATYSTQDGAADIEFAGLANGLKETIELAGPSAPSAYLFRLDASQGVTPTLAEDGSIKFKTADDAVVAEVPAPVMFDSAGTLAPPDAVSYSLEAEDEGSWKLTVEADPLWLADPDRTWPLVIDPSITLPSPELDCAIANQANSGNSFCGTSGWPFLGVQAAYKSSGADEFSRTLLRFNVSSIPKTASLTSATIGLNSVKTATNVTKVDLYDVSRSWNNSVTWGYAKSGGNVAWTSQGGDFGKLMPNPASVSTAERGSQPGPWIFSGSALLNLVETWRTSSSAFNNGVLIKLADEQPRVCCIERRIEWESSTGANKPYLSVQYILPAPPDSQVTCPANGTKTAKRFLLKAGWDHSNVEGVTFQYKPETSYMWSDIPVGRVIDKDGQPVTWPLEADIDNRETETFYWDASNLSGAKGTAKVKIRAVLSGSVGASGYTKAVEAELDRNGGGAKDATAPIGPGGVNLLTGNFSVSRTDVAIPGFEAALQFSRSIGSRELPEKPGVLGPGWKAGAPVEEAGGSAWRSLKIESKTEEFEGEIYTEKWALLTPIQGQALSFEVGPNNEFVTPPEMSGNVLYRLSESQIAFTDPAGNRTIFSNFGSGIEYWPISVAQTGGPGNTTRMIYEIEGTNRRLKQVIAPAAENISCSDETATTTQGCRVLVFNYLAPGYLGLPAGSGDRLTKITFYAPGHGGPWDVASYSYDSEGRLAAAWDPRISPALKETYAYTAGGQLKTLTPPGEEPWTMSYDTDPGGTIPGRLVNVKRPSLVAANPTAQLTVAYGVPLSTGAGGPYDMSPQDVATWGQEDLPADATAIFPPDEVPATPPSSYAFATVYYMDAEGQTVNTASPEGAGLSGPSISTMETDVFGNLGRELTPENRLRALAAGSGSVAKSKELDTQFKYSTDGVLLLDERGPVHAVRLETGAEAGAVVQARDYHSFQYDKGAPEPKAGETWPLLTTHETIGALVSGKVLDQRTVEYTYDWPLRRQIGSVADPEGLAIKSVTKYDAVTGLPIEIRQPKDAGSAGAGTTKITYYKKETGGQNGECLKTIYAGWPCRIEPVSQPLTGPHLPITSFIAYSPLGKPTQIVEETTGSTPGTRTTHYTYDSAGRPITKWITGGGTQVPKVETVYNSSNGLATTRRFVCPSNETGCDQQTITATPDALGRVTKYEDADGNQATTTYDLNGRPLTFNDGKGTQTFSYDSATGLLVGLTDSMAGTFTASYNADGQMTARGLPNGLTSEAVYDAAGAATDLTYTKASNCGASCTWLDFEVARSSSGKILSESGTLGTNKYSYDRVGRLTKAEEKPVGGGCTTRSYTFDQDSNRTSMTTRPPGIGGICVSSGGSSQGYSYDGADRLEAAGLIYDAFGRITSLPGTYAGGGTLQTSYFSNDMIASQSQGGVTNTFALDAALRQRQRTQGGGLEGVEIFHYSGGSDSPAWTQLGETWTRNITGIGGELVALAQSSSATRLQLTNLHGDVVATASVNPSDTQFSFTARLDEFGKPVSGTPGRFGWLGGAQRRTEFPSGVIQMGARSYVPAMGRFLSGDPIAGGSVSAYDYGNADPVNQFDPSGLKPHDNDCDHHIGGITGCQVWLHIKMWAPRGGRMGVRMIYTSNRTGGISIISFEITYWMDAKNDVYKEGFVLMPPPRYINSYPGIPSSCRNTDPCANNHDGTGTFSCIPGNEYQIGIRFKYNYNVGAEVDVPQSLEVKAQEFCTYQ
jgi:RHS repeat-associated protein